MSQSIFKVVLLGDGAVGKTSIRERYFGREFKQVYYLATVADFEVKRVKLKNRFFTFQI